MTATSGSNVIVFPSKLSSAENAATVDESKAPEMTVARYATCQAVEETPGFKGTLLKNELKTAGNHSEVLNFNPSLSPGNYVLVISNGNKKVSIKLLKQ